jgi:hypothetical protein
MIDLDQLLDEEETQLASLKDSPSTDNDDVKAPVDSNPNQSDDDYSAGSNDDSTSDDKDNSIDVDQDAQAYFDFLKVEEVLDVPDDFVFKGNSDSIKEALSLTKKNIATKVAQQIWQTLPDDFKPLLEYGLSGGTDLNEFLTASKITDIESLSLDDDISRKAVIRSYYKILNPKIDDAQIEKRIDKLSEIADLHEEAEDALEYLKTYKDEQRSALILETQAKKEQQILALKKELDTYVNLIDKNDEFDSNRKNRLKSFLLVPHNDSIPFELALDAIYENPQHKIQLANILADYDPNLGFSFDRIQKKLNNKATQSFKELINSKLEPKSQIKGTSKPSKEDFDWDNFFQ